MIERMDEFFTRRVKGYDAHMLDEVVGREGYRQLARQLPDGARRIVDLGCGTGLELEYIYERFPDAELTGIDLTRAMLDELRRKYPDKSPELVEGSYFDYDFGCGRFDAAVSFESLHHFTKEVKGGLYRRVWAGLRPGGVFVDCDYMVPEQKYEDLFFAEGARLRREAGIGPDEFYHYDTPLTVENERALMLTAGFARVELVWQSEDTVMLRAVRE